MKISVFSLFIILLASCAGSNNVRILKTDVLSEQRQLQELSKKTDTLDDLRVFKEAQGQLDPTTDSITKVYIERLKDSVNVRLNYFNALLSDRKAIKKNQQKTLAYLNAAKQDYSKDLNNIIFLDDLFKASTFNRLNTAAFFGPGEYELTASASAQAAAIMENIIKDAFNFSMKHSDRKLKAMFVVLGYADEQEVNKNSELYNQLITDIGMKTADRMRLNTELSNKRASSIKKILKDKYRFYFTPKEGYLFSSSFVATGKGEILPSGNVQDYHSADDRRRVVLLYWSILPDLN